MADVEGPICRPEEVPTPGHVPPPSWANGRFKEHEAEQKEEREPEPHEGEDSDEELPTLLQSPQANPRSRSLKHGEGKDEGSGSGGDATPRPRARVSVDGSPTLFEQAGTSSGLRAGLRKPPIQLDLRQASQHISSTIRGLNIEPVHSRVHHRSPVSRKPDEELERQTQEPSVIWRGESPSWRTNPRLVGRPPPSETGSRPELPLADWLVRRKAQDKPEKPAEPQREGAQAATAETKTSSGEEEPRRASSRRQGFRSSDVVEVPNPQDAAAEGASGSYAGQHSPVPVAAPQPPQQLPPHVVQQQPTHPPHPPASQWQWPTEPPAMSPSASPHWHQQQHQFMPPGSQSPGMQQQMQQQQQHLQQQQQLHHHHHHQQQQYDSWQHQQQYEQQQQQHQHYVQQQLQQQQQQQQYEQQQQLQYQQQQQQYEQQQLQQQQQLQYQQQQYHQQQHYQQPQQQQQYQQPYQQPQQQYPPSPYQQQVQPAPYQQQPPPQQQQVPGPYQTQQAPYPAQQYQQQQQPAYPPQAPQYQQPQQYPQQAPPRPPYQQPYQQYQQPPLQLPQQVMSHHMPQQSVQQPSPQAQQSPTPTWSQQWGQQSPFWAGKASPVPVSTPLSTAGTPLNFGFNTPMNAAAPGPVGGTPIVVGTPSGQVPQLPTSFGITGTGPSASSATNRVYDKLMMLRFRSTAEGRVHRAVQSLRTRTRPAEKPGLFGSPSSALSRASWGQMAWQPHLRSGAHNASARRARWDMQKATEGLKPSATGYRMKGQPSSREEEMERRVLSLLNKICPTNLQTIVDQLAAIDLKSASDMEVVIRGIFSKALREPHYCETYADMVFQLRSRFPDFPPEEGEGDKPVNFTRVLVNAVQNEFERMPATFGTDGDEAEEGVDDTADVQNRREQQEQERRERKGRLMANMKFIGHLFLRRLLAVKVIGTVVFELIGERDGDSRLPGEHCMEATCELLQAIGYTMDSTQDGRSLMDHFLGQLWALADMPADTAAGLAFSKRARFQIQDLQDLRSNGWVKKLFKEQARTKDEIKKDAASLNVGMRARGGTTEVTFSTQTAGVRPSYITSKAKPVGQVFPPKSGDPGVFRPTILQRHSSNISNVSNSSSQLAATEEPSASPALPSSFCRLEALRVLQIYSEEHSWDGFLRDWRATARTAQLAEEGMACLIDLGFNESSVREVASEVVFLMVLHGFLRLDVLGRLLAPHLAHMEDLLLDEPRAEDFVKSFLERLLRANHSQGLSLTELITASLAAESDAGSPGRSGLKSLWARMVASAMERAEAAGQETLVRASLRYDLCWLSVIPEVGNLLTSATLQRMLVEEAK